MWWAYKSDWLDCSLQSEEKSHLGSSNVTDQLFFLEYVCKLFPHLEIKYMKIFCSTSVMNNINFTSCTTFVVLNDFYLCQVLYIGSWKKNYQILKIEVRLISKKRIFCQIFVYILTLKFTIEIVILFHSQSEVSCQNILLLITVITITKKRLA